MKNFQMFLILSVISFSIAACSQTKVAENRNAATTPMPTAAPPTNTNDLKANAAPSATATNAPPADNEYLIKAHQ